MKNMCISKKNICTHAQLIMINLVVFFMCFSCRGIIWGGIIMTLLKGCLKGHSGSVCFRNPFKVLFFVNPSFIARFLWGFIMNCFGAHDHVKGSVFGVSSWIILGLMTMLKGPSLVASRYIRGPFEVDSGLIHYIINTFDQTIKKAGQNAK